MHIYTVEHVHVAICCSSVEGWIIADASIPASRRDYTVRGLSPARRYHLRVFAWNDVGMGAPSLSSNVIEIPQEGEL